MRCKSGGKHGVTADNPPCILSCMCFQMTQVFSHSVSETNELDANYMDIIVWHIIAYAEYPSVCSQFVEEINLWLIIHNPLPVVNYGHTYIHS